MLCIVEVVETTCLAEIIPISYYCSCRRKKQYEKQPDTKNIYSIHPSLVHQGPYETDSAEQREIQEQGYY